MQWIDSIPLVVKALLALGGALVTALAPNVLPPVWQAVGLGVGIALLAVGLSALGLHVFHNSAALASYRLRWPIARVTPIAASPEINKMVSLFEFARNAYEATRHGAVGKAAAHSTSEKGILTWYACYLKDKYQLYGSQPPSRLLELVDLRGYHFVIDNSESIIAIEQYGKKKWINMQLTKEDADAALLAISNLNSSFATKPPNTGI